MVTIGYAARLIPENSQPTAPGKASAHPTRLEQQFIIINIGH
jgi:hypothetical protein